MPLRVKDAYTKIIGISLLLLRLYSQDTTYFYVQVVAVP